MYLFPFLCSLFEFISMCKESLNLGQVGRELVKKAKLTIRLE
jgi:hypothetical protein